MGGAFHRPGGCTLDTATGNWGRKVLQKLPHHLISCFLHRVCCSAQCVLGFATDTPEKKKSLQLQMFTGHGCAQDIYLLVPIVPLRPISGLFIAKLVWRKGSRGTEYNRVYFGKGCVLAGADCAGALAGLPGRKPMDCKRQSSRLGPYATWTAWRMREGEGGGGGDGRGGQMKVAAPSVGIRAYDTTQRVASQPGPTGVWRTAAQAVCCSAEPAALLKMKASASALVMLPLPSPSRSFWTCWRILALDLGLLLSSVALQGHGVQVMRDPLAQSDRTTGGCLGPSNSQQHKL